MGPEAMIIASFAVKVGGFIMQSMAAKQSAEASSQQAIFDAEASMLRAQQAAIDAQSAEIQADQQAMNAELARLEGERLANANREIFAEISALNLARAMVDPTTSPSLLAIRNNNKDINDENLSTIGLNTAQNIRTALVNEFQGRQSAAGAQLERQQNLIGSKASIESSKASLKAGRLGQISPFFGAATEGFKTKSKLDKTRVPKYKAPTAYPFP